jgi:hypothetical protein
MKKQKKSKRSTVPSIPQLSLEVLDAVQKIERYTRQQLHDCNNRVNFNTEKAERILRTCTVQVLRTLLTYYESLPTFHEGWIIQLQESSIESAVGMVPPGFSGVYEHMRNILWDTTYADLNPPKTLTAVKELRKDQLLSRKQLRDSYLKKFPDTKILDICWAAGQRYSEWKRWLRNAVKDGSAPDRAFRALVESAKPPSEYRRENRPRGWK